MSPRIGRQRVGLAEIGVGLLELPERSLGLAEANEICRRRLRARGDHALERAGSLSALAEVQLEASELERGVAPGRSRRGRGQKLFRFRIAAVIDVDTGAQRDRARVGRGSKNLCDLVVLSEIECFARGVKRRVGAGPRLRAQQRRNREKEAARDEKLLHGAAPSIFHSGVGIRDSGFARPRAASSTAIRLRTSIPKARSEITPLRRAPTIKAKPAISPNTAT